MGLLVLVTWLTAPLYVRPHIHGSALGWSVIGNDLVCAAVIAAALALSGRRWLVLGLAMQVIALTADLAHDFDRMIDFRSWETVQLVTSLIFNFALLLATLLGLRARRPGLIGAGVRAA